LPSIIFAAKSLNLVQVISETFDKINQTTDNIDKYPQNLLDEWNEFHAKNIFGILIPYYIEVCGKFVDNYLNLILIK